VKKTEAVKNRILDKAYELGFEYEKKYRGCSQCAIAAVFDTLNIKEDAVFKAATGFAGGGGLTGMSVCGGYAAGVMIIGHLCGRERSDFSDPERIRFRTFEYVKNFTQRYIGELGSIICRDIQALRFDRPYYLADPDDFVKFEEAGGHRDKCTDVVGKSAQLTVKFLLEEGLFSLE
jgi:C_GCAxxG_C_C family probable redox protein